MTPRSPRTQLASTFVAVVVLLTLAALAGCGGARHAGSTHSHTSRAGASRGAGVPPTRPRALAFARGVNLTPADVPEFSAGTPEQQEGGAQKRLERQLRRCTGPVGAGSEVAQVPSSRYRLRRGIVDLSVSSEVGVAQSTGAAGRELAALRSGRVRGCFARYLDLLLKEGRYRGATPRPVAIAAGTPPAPGAVGSFAWRITATFTVQRIPFSLYVDILGFVVGPARVTLVSSGALRPFPAVIQQRLFNLLLARATALTV